MFSCVIKVSVVYCFGTLFALIPGLSWIWCVLIVNKRLPCPLANPELSVGPKSVIKAQKGPVENSMDEVATKIIDILKKHSKADDAVVNNIGTTTELSALEIESLDLAMIVFDIEDAFGVEIPYNANEEEAAGDFKTVGSVVDKVRGLMAGSGSDAASASA